MMKLSEAHKVKLNDAISKLQDETLDVMKSASVLLRFPEGSGSGVVIYLNSKSTFTVLTALHNLSMYDKANRNENQNNQALMVGGSVHYLSTTTIVTHTHGLSRSVTTNKHQKNSKAKILEITRDLGLGNIDMCLLLCEIESTASGLPHCVAGPYSVAMHDSVEYRARSHVDAFERIKNSPHQYGPPEDKDQYTFFQVGYGRGPNDGELFGATLDKRQFKLSTPKELNKLQGITCKNDDGPNFNNLILLDSDAENSTLKGDSGGPLYCVEQCFKEGKVWREQIFVIGVTKGADDVPMESDEEDDPNKPDGWLNNSVTSVLGYWEQQLG